MADFCKQCSIDTFGKDHGDLAGLITEQDTKEGYGMWVLCEGCGPAWVDHTGFRMNDPTITEDSAGYTDEEVAYMNGHLKGKEEVLTDLKELLDCVGSDDSINKNNIVTALQRILNKHTQ